MPHVDLSERRRYHREYYKKRLAEDPVFKQKHRDRVDKNTEKYKVAVDEMLEKFRANGCFSCDEKDPVCLDAHHLESSEKDFNIGDARRRKLSPKKVFAELQKCICLCSNCHRKIHAVQ